MPSRKIHSLSLALTERHINISDNSPRTPLCALPIQHSVPPLDINTEALAIAQSSTMFQRGLITPPTTCYFLQANTDKNNKKTQKGGNLCHQQQQQLPEDHDSTMLDNNTIITTTPQSPADDDFSFSLEEFGKRYVPLSHLPTPPLSDFCSVDIHPTTGGYDAGAGGGGQIDAEFWGTWCCGKLLPVI